MKRTTFSLFSLLALAVVINVAQRPALAAPLYLGQLTSSDAGPTNAVSLSPQNTYRISCVIPACYRADADAGGLLADGCGKARLIPGSSTSDLIKFDGSDGGLSLLAPSRFEEEFDSAGQSGIVVLAVDAGDPSCQLFQSTKNLVKALFQ